MGSRLEKGSNAVRKAIESHTFNSEDGEEYEPSKFGGFPEYFRRKKIKLQNLDVELRAQSTDNPPIFRGVVAHVNGYTQPSLNDIHKMIVSYGGGFIQYLDNKTMVTHIIASSLTPKKAVEFKRYRIVKPAWIVDSIAAGKLLPWHNYSVVDEGAGQKVLQLDGGRVSTQVNTKQRGYKDQTDTSWYTSQLNQPDSSRPDGSSYQLDSEQAPIATDSHVQDESTTTADEGDPEKEWEDTVQELQDIADAGELLELNEQDLAADGTHNEGEVEAKVEAIHDLESPNADHRGRHLLEPHVPLDMQDGDDLEEGDNQSDEPGEDVDLREGLADFSAKKRQAEEEAGPDGKRVKMTAEEHNTLLLSDPRIRKSSVLNPDFLEQYYRESRLHHLSTWKAELKSKIQAMTAEQSASQKARQQRKPGARRYVLHVDFDSFFVAVSLKKQPQFVDTPAVVAHGSGSGSEIASCNYPARKFGVSNGMWMKRALELCKDLKVLPYDFPAYEAASQLFYQAIIATGGIIQSVSIDEALVDITALCLPAGGTDGIGVREGSLWREQAKADEIALALRNKVKDETGCNVSVGIGGNVLLAKVALRKAKPAGQYQIKPDEVLDFIGELPVKSLPGVAYSIGGRLEEAGVTFVKDIRGLTKERLISILGPKTGDKIWNYSRGIDRAEVGDQVVRKSVSAEVNWGVRFETQEQAEDFVESLCGELERRLLKERVRGRHLTMKIMRRSADAPRDPPKHLGHGKCDTYNKSVVLGVATNDKKVIAREVLSIMRGFNFSPGELRGLGVQMTKLEVMKMKGADGTTVANSQMRLLFKPGPSKPEFSAAPKESAPVPTKPQIEQDQKTLQFQPTVKFKLDGTTSDDASSQALPKPNSQRGPLFKSVSSQQRQRFENTGVDESIDDPETPRKQKPSAKGAAMISSIFRGNDSPSRKPLNTTGTQFILPTQVDPKILAELPEDIRSKLMKNLKPSEAAALQAAVRDAPITALPNQSQLDPEILGALPASLRAEILAEYSPSKSNSRRAGDQAVLPQSPRKDRTVTARKPIPAKARGKPGKSLLSRLRGDNSTLTQANFVAHTTASDTDEPIESSKAALDEDFLAALPPDIRKEVVEEHRRTQLKERSNLEIPKPRGRAHRSVATAAVIAAAGLTDADTTDAATTDDEQAGEVAVITLPAKPAKPTFTSRKLSQPAELRDAVGAWWREFRADGPYQEDSDALATYLRRVVLEEGDLDKAVAVVKWLAWLMDSDESFVAAASTSASVSFDGGESSSSSTQESVWRKWVRTLEEIKNSVNDAVKRKGLGAVEF